MESGKITPPERQPVQQRRGAGKPQDRSEFLRVLKENIRAGNYNPDLKELAEIMTPFLDKEV